MKDGGYEKCAHEGAGLSQNGSTGTRTKNDEEVSIKLVPAEIPELLDRGGHPRSVEKTGPRGSRLAEDGSPDHCFDVILQVDHCVHPQAAHYAAECSQSGAGHKGEVWVKDTTAFWVVCGWAERLNDVL